MTVIVAPSSSSRPLKMKISNPPSRLAYCIIVPCLVSVIYILLSLFLFKYTNPFSASLQKFSSETSLEHIVFGIASAEQSWSRRKEYVKLWWKPAKMKECVFLEKMPPNTSLSETDRLSLPPIYVSSDTSQFPYSHKKGPRSAIRVARVVAETVASIMNQTNGSSTDVRWFVFGDDDTIFFPENLVETLSKYDHGLWYYIGSNSEDLQANKVFSFDMAFGGAGFAISFPLAKVLTKVLDSCLERYHHLYGSDARIHACIAELGITLTREPGFHQIDFQGSLFGLLTAHPTRPLVSLHYMEAVEPIFPSSTRLNSFEHLMEAVKADSQRILQQTVCYDKWFSWTISVAWGYAVQLMGINVLLPDVLRAQETFRPWNGRASPNLDTQGYHPDPCERPIVFFFDSVSSSRDGSMTSVYKLLSQNCTYGKKIDEIRVFSKKLEPDMGQLHAPRRQCCDVLRSSANSVVEIGIRECGEEELIRMHP